MDADDDLTERGEGSIGLKKLGHVLLGYLEAMGGHATLPGHLALEARPAPAAPCAVCGRSVPGGDLTLRRREDGFEVTMPFLAVHALASHGVASFTVKGASSHGEAPVGELVEILNYEVYARGKMLSRYLSHTTAPPSHLVLDQRPERGFETCADCGETVNMGAFVVENAHTQQALELRYLAAHAMACHKDRRYRGSLHQGEVNLHELRAIMDHSEAYRALGRALEGYLVGMGGQMTEPPSIELEEHPVRSFQTCQACNAEVNAGTFVARRRSATAEAILPYLAVHSLAAHGDAYFKGAVHQGWIDMALLGRIMG
jgi:hypothetical protein